MTKTTEEIITNTKVASLNEWNNIKNNNWYSEQEVKNIFEAVENIVCASHETCGIDSQTTGELYWCVSCRPIIKLKQKWLNQK